jgi:RND family efflux transporter MFP subunit
VLGIASLAAVPVVAGELPAPSVDVIELRHCEVNYRRSSLVGVAHMGTSMTSVLQDCFVKLGDRVKAGQILGRIADREIKVELDLRAAEAENLLDLRISETRSDQAQNRLKRTEKLQKRNTTYVPAEERVSQELDLAAAKLQVEESKYELRLAELKRRQAEALMHAREYISPHDGVVVEIQKEQGEAVSINEPNFRVVDVDWLKVTGYLNLPDFWRVRSGLEVRVAAEIDGQDLPIEREVFVGRIVFVDRRIDPVARTCKVVAEVANRDLLLASGLEARMEILIKNPSEDRAPGSSPPVAPHGPSEPVSRRAVTDALSGEPNRATVRTP